MSFWSHWQRLITLGPTLARRAPSPKPGKNRPGRRMALEPLEDRMLLSAALLPNKAGYAPMETALLTATGFRAGETVNLHVVRDDGTSYAPWSVTDGGASDL